MWAEAFQRGRLKEGGRSKIPENNKLYVPAPFTVSY